MPESEAEQKAVLKEWEAWFGKIGSNLVDGGNPFTPKAKSIASDGKVSDGPVGAMASGYSVITLPEAGRGKLTQKKVIMDGREHPSIITFFWVFAPSPETGEGRGRG